MSEPKVLPVKREPKESKNKQYSDGSAFSNIADDGLLTGPSVKTATQTEDGALLSDDENKTLTTLEPPKKPERSEPNKTLTTSEAPKKPVRDEPKKIIPAGVAKKSSNPAQSTKTLKQTFVTERDLLKTLKEQTSPSKHSPPEFPSRDDLIQKMRNRLSKQIEIKSTSPVTPATPTKPLDTSGAIEIPHDLILSSEIPPTPISSLDSKATVFEDHDLIAILEGNDVEIHENATEIEVCVGGNSTEDGMEEMEIMILDQDDLQQAKKEREREIARRQIESLPTLPKQKRRAKVGTKSATQPSDDALPSGNASTVGTVPVAQTQARAAQSPLPKLPPGVTIKGQTTIRPVVKKSPIESKQPKEEKVSPPKQSKNGTDTVKPSAVRVPAGGTAKVSKAMKPPAAVVESSSKVSPVRVKTPPDSPPTPSKSSELVDSLVSDWDDEPTATATAKPSNVSGATESKPIVVAPTVATVAQDLPEKAKFVAPSLPSAGEPRRVIKKKIIWDPSVATIPFAALVKSNRANPPPAQSPPNGGAMVSVPPQGATTPMGQVRRKRADSVAVRMFEYVPQQPVRKRALTPEPAQLTVSSEVVVMETPVENKNTPTGTTTLLDAKAKKRKRNEIERLLADEGAINMLYDVECEANQKDLLKNTAVDTSDVDEKLLAKAKIITDAVINQGKSPTEGPNQPGPRVRPKRAPTPSNQPGVDRASPRPEPTGQTAATVPPPAATKRNSNTTTVPLTGARKRKTTAAQKDWDYVYNAQGGDDAMIIRRRSNSSYSSSCASPRRLSIDLSYESPAAGVSSTAANLPKQEPLDDGFLFAKPPDKSTPPSAGRTLKSASGSGDGVKLDTSLLANMRGKLSKALKNIKGEAVEANAKKTSSPPTAAATKGAPKPPQVKRKVGKPSPNSSVDAVDQPVSEGEDAAGVPAKQENVLSDAIEELKQISCTRTGDYVEIVLRSKGVVSGGGSDPIGPLSDVFSFEAMNELSSVLTLLEKESQVKAVLLMSAGAHFSRGLDVAHLIQPVQKRKPVAEEMGECLKSFLKSLISFPKPIVAAVHGDVLGMGVTLLPVFDIVLVQSGSTFITPYGHFGYLPEAMQAFTGCRPMKSKALTDLLLQGKRISTAVALDYGLVTESITADRFHDRAHGLVKKVASQSSQAMQSIKLHLRREFLAKLDFVLSLEQKKHTQQWTTVECQQKFRLFVSKGGELGKLC